MSKFRAFWAGLAAIGLLAVPAEAQKASSMEELLGRIENLRADAAAALDKNVKAYNALPAAEKESRLAAAEQKRAELQAVSDGLTATYQANESKIFDLNNQLNAKATSLGLTEVFGLSRQVAGDVATVLQQSLVATQFPPGEGELYRDEFLREFSASRKTPVISDIQRLWVEMHREIQADGQVARYATKVVQPSGEAVESSVVRIGPFTAISDGKFLQNLPALRSLSTLPRQPAAFTGIGGAFERATEGYVPAVVDPFRGVTLGLYVQRPNIIERIQRGEAVGYVILTVGAAGAAAFLFQLVYLIFVRMAVSRQLKDLDRPRRDNPLGRVLLAFRGDANSIEDNADIAELRIAEAVLHEEPSLERFQPFLRLCVAAGPLLGLIGTVVGMIITFQSITESGSSDPRLMATGIGQAMIATVLGLGIAIPLLFANALLNSLSKNVIQILDEQSAGILAESLERKRGA